jgi:hypothetical protein
MTPDDTPKASPHDHVSPGQAEGASPWPLPEAEEAAPDAPDGEPAGRFLDRHRLVTGCTFDGRVGPGDGPLVDGHARRVFARWLEEHARPGDCLVFRPAAGDCYPRARVADVGDPDRLAQDVMVWLHQQGFQIGDSLFVMRADPTGPGPADAPEHGPATADIRGATGHQRR